MSIVLKYILTIIWNIVTMAKKVSYTFINAQGEIENVKDKVKHINKQKNNIVYFDIGLYLVIPIFAGILLGQYLDGITNKKPFFTLLFIILGTIITFYNLFKLIKDVKNSND